MEKINKSFLSSKTAICLIAVFLVCITFINIIDIHYKYKFINFILSVLFIFSILVILLISDLKNKFFIYLENVLIEKKKVVWPERMEVIKITLLVFIFVFIMGLFLWIIDASLGWFIYNIILSWR